jgi:hypothetical protein
MDTKRLMTTKKFLTPKQLFHNRIAAAVVMAMLAAVAAVYAAVAREYFFLIPAGLTALAAALAFQLAFECRRYDPK